MAEQTSSPLLSLPLELVLQIVSKLSVLDLVALSKSCRSLYQYSLDDKLWRPFVETRVNRQLESPKPFGSFRTLYASLHPFWFLPHRRIWFASSVHTGKLLLARFDQRIGAIEAYVVVAEHGQQTATRWQHKPEVMVYQFHPRVRLDLNVPVLRIDVEAIKNYLSDGPLLRQEISMNIHETFSPTTAKIYSCFMFTRSMRSHDMYQSMDIWPPHILPSGSRCRNTSSNEFRDPGHKPAALAELSEDTFRIRKWVDFSSERLMGMSMRVGEDVTTYASLEEKEYTPTKKKPWRGIWCGEYAAHGCEFIVILQPDRPHPLPTKAIKAYNEGEATRTRGRFSYSDSNSDENYEADNSAAESSAPYESLLLPNSIDSDDERGENGLLLEGERVHNGQLLGVKLTGDQNIPRGEYTFIAPDIGPKGFIRTSDDDDFRGAPVVKSVGHVAQAGYKDGKPEYLLR